MGGSFSILRSTSSHRSVNLMASVWQTRPHVWHRVQSVTLVVKSGLIASNGQISTHLLQLMQVDSTFRLVTRKRFPRDKDSPARADVLAPEARLQKSQSQHAQKQHDGKDVSQANRRNLVSVFHHEKLKRFKQHQQPARDDGNRCDEAGHKHSAECHDERPQQNVVLDVNPPAVVGILEASDSATDRPVEQIDQRPQRAEVSAEAARNKNACQQDRSGTGERPDPAASGDRR